MQITPKLIAQFSKEEIQEMIRLHLNTHGYNGTSIKLYGNEGATAVVTKIENEKRSKSSVYLPEEVVQTLDALQHMGVEKNVLTHALTYGYLPKKVLKIYDQVSFTKDEHLEGLKLNTYVLSFDSAGDNYLFANYLTLSQLKQFVQQQGMVKLYNDWLDFICSDHIAEKVEFYMIGRVIEEKESGYLVEVVETGNEEIN